MESISEAFSKCFVADFIATVSRTIEDKNNNYEWDYYSIKKKIDSERITYYPELIEILSNWTIEDLLFDVEESVEKMFE